MTDRLLPADTDAERATLGSILLNRDAIIAIASWLAPAHFYLEVHKWTYEAMLACYNQHEPPDLRLVSSQLREREQLDLIGGTPFLVGLTDAVPTSYHIEYYARRVERTALLRALIGAGATISRIGYDEAADLDQSIADAYAALDQATTRAADERQLVPLASIVEQRYADLDAVQQAGGTAAIGLPSGLADYDGLTGGLHNSDLVIVAARPGVGKSSLALCVTANVAERGERVDVFSMEMSKAQCLDRLIAIRSGINLMHIRQLAIGERELPAYMDALGWAHQLPIAIDDTPALTLDKMRTRVLRRAGRDGLPGLIVVDYLGLMRAPKTKSRYEEVSEIARGLKNLAKELDRPVLALCQLSRAVEGRQSHVPMLSDLRESGELEQAADLVVFIYREELYDKETDKRGIAELHIAKHRHGPVGVVPVQFDASTTRFSDLSYRALKG